MLTDPSNCDRLSLRWLALRLYLSPYDGSLPEKFEMGGSLLSGDGSEKNDDLNLIRMFGLKDSLIGRDISGRARDSYKTIAAWNLRVVLPSADQATRYANRFRERILR